MAATTVSGHGLIRSVEGANGVSAPGLTVTDGTPRDCVNNACGAQADTGIIRDGDIAAGKVGPLGMTQGTGPVDIGAHIANFMGTGPAPATNKGAASSVGVEDNFGGLFGTPKERREEHRRQMADLFKGVSNLPIIGTLGAGGTRKTYPVETLNADMRGQGAEKGLPTCDDKGVVHVVYRQINQDGAGPMTAAIDGTSGGTDPKAFVSARILMNVPGSGISGLSFSTNTDYPMSIEMPQGMVCEGEREGVKHMCIVRVRNQAFAGPFGGGGFFTQSKESRKRAIAYRLKKRMEIGRTE
ncbi:hypothetical protein QQS21_005885 [Conoideocrella luteorostrata]|uniref:Cell surface protein (Mas1) n=1 Tax=Conoideocrella luteorostrata TaxID=1105319 RepID=A0AAJ0G0K0_9HYPO|nr:hypothetical protein QQS21_005885 [Conoideocrella luteorostrata]